MRKVRGAALIALALSFGATAPVEARERCYDAVVLATIVAQTPTDVEYDDVFVVAWPWIVDLDVQRVTKGRAPLGPLTVLSIQHTYIQNDLGAQRWWLRRNTLGGFNVLNSAAARRCGGPPAPPYIRPGPGVTLDGLRAEGVRRFGTGP